MRNCFSKFSNGFTFYYLICHKNVCTKLLIFENDTRLVVSKIKFIQSLARKYRQINEVLESIFSLGIYYTIKQFLVYAERICFHISCKIIEI